jgi:hypothetical protein
MRKMREVLRLIITILIVGIFYQINPTRFNIPSLVLGFILGCIFMFNSIQAVLDDWFNDKEGDENE